MEELIKIYQGAFVIEGDKILSKDDPRYQCILHKGCLEYTTPNGVFTIFHIDNVSKTFKKTAPRYMNMKKYIIELKKEERIKELIEENKLLKAGYVKPLQFKYKKRGEHYYFHWNSENKRHELGHELDNWCADPPKYYNGFVTHDDVIRLSKLNLLDNYHNRCTVCDPDFREYCHDEDHLLPSNGRMFHNIDLLKEKVDELSEHLWNAVTLISNREKRIDNLEKRVENYEKLISLLTKEH